ncbi:MAG: DUF6788 family protein [Candidatus Zixiibacteriota bacterium]
MEQYENVKSEIEPLGFVMQGSVIKRTKQCGQPNCRCHRGQQYEHGPYYQWTRKVKAKTVTKVLTPPEARLYKKCIRNERRLRKILAKMYRISSRAVQCLSDERQQPK